MKKPSRKPDFRVSTPSQVNPERWIDIGAAWASEAEDDTKYISITLDVMPPTGRLTLFPISKDKST